MNSKEYIINHYKKNWDLENSYYTSLEEGPMKDLKSDFCILVIPPNQKRNMWTYATVGMATDRDVNEIELHIFSEKENNQLIEILTVIAYYQITTHSLGLNHTVNFGVPIIPKSHCYYGLISLPYLDGENLEKLKRENKLISFYWLIPITKPERDYKHKYGIEALEDIFETEGLNYLDPYRDSLISETN